MYTEQIKLLHSLAKEIKDEKKVKQKIIRSLKEAKILTKSGKLTSKFGNRNLSYKTNNVSM